MEILNESTINDCVYVVWQSKYLRGQDDLRSRVYAKGEPFIAHESMLSSEILGLCNMGALYVSLPAVARYITRRGFTLRIEGMQKEQVKRDEIVELKAADAWGLLLSRNIEPLDETLWSPGKLLREWHHKAK